METFKIALYPGDGIGVDVTREAVRVLRAAEQVIGTYIRTSALLLKQHLRNLGALSAQPEARAGK